MTLTKKWYALQAILALTATSANAQEKSSDLHVFKQWTRVINHEHVIKPEKPFEGDLLALLTETENKYKNYKYIEDIQNYGVHEYWATRDEFKKHGGGDCEDFAISEYFDLLEAGVPDSDMEIVVAEIRITHEMHAVLKVKDYILDVKKDHVYKQSEAYSYYYLLYGINREGWHKFL